MGNQGLMTREIGLVSCVKSKRTEPATPKNLYTSDYFDKMRSYAERHHDDWFILSAKHGLVDPDGDPISPYDLTLRDATTGEKRAWAKDVREGLKQRNLLEDGVTLVIHAGKDYYGELLTLLEEDAVSVEIPTEGLGIGEKKAWYKERL